MNSQHFDHHFLVRRKSKLDGYLQWAFPYQNFIGEPRTKSSILAFVKTALFQEVSTSYKDNELVMCRHTRFEREFGWSHVLLTDLLALLEPFLVPVTHCPSVNDSDEDCTKTTSLPLDSQGSDMTCSDDEGYDSA